jgi:hypothetical protein
MLTIDTASPTDLTRFKNRLARHQTLAPLLEAHLTEEMLAKLEATFMVRTVANVINSGLIGAYRQIDWTKESNHDRICMSLPEDIVAEEAITIAALCGMDPYDILHAHIRDRLTELHAYD